MRSPSPRRDFLARLGLGAAAAVAGAALPAPLAAVERADSRRDARPEAHPAAHPAAAPGSTWDMSWTDRVTGRFRAVFDSPHLGEGAALYRAVGWRKQYQEVYGTEPAEMSAVVVFRHEAIPLVMNDEYWRRFKVGKEVKLKSEETKRWWEANPIRTTSADVPPRFADYSLERFLATGGIVLGCNLAFRDIVGRFMKEDKLDKAAAEQRAKEQLLPGVVLQPSGVFAALRAQEAGCRYILAS